MPALSLVMPTGVATGVATMPTGVMPAVVAMVAVVPAAVVCHGRGCGSGMGHGGEAAQRGRERKHELFHRDGGSKGELVAQTYSPQMKTQ